MSLDISHALQGWDFEPHELNVRVIVGDDGHEKVQMRIDLGLLQMAIDGRPDGERPDGFESLLECYQHEAASYGDGYLLGEEAIDSLYREGLQYYHRYLCLFHLARYELVERDTERNLRLFDFVAEHAPGRRERWRFDQYRPYVLMMKTRAAAMISLERGDSASARGTIASGSQDIQRFLESNDRPIDDCFELDFLRRWLEELDERPAADAAADSESDTPTEQARALRAKLRDAIEREDYETAASLRDRLKQLESTGRRKPPTPPSSPLHE